MALVYLAWLETNPRKSIAVRLAEASARFAERTGRAPTVVRVHPETTVPDDLAARGLRIEVTRAMPRGQVWPGVESAAVDEAPEGRAR